MFTSCSVQIQIIFGFISGASNLHCPTDELIPSNIGFSVVKLHISTSVTSSSALLTDSDIFNYTSHLTRLHPCQPARTRLSPCFLQNVEVECTVKDAACQLIFSFFPVQTFITLFKCISRVSRSSTATEWPLGNPEQSNTAGGHPLFLYAAAGTGASDCSGQITVDSTGENRATIHAWPLPTNASRPLPLPLQKHTSALKSII